jgi:hypothetical protein
MGHILRHFLTATALLGTTTGQGNSDSLVGALLNPVTSANLAVSADGSASASFNLNPDASSAMLRASASIMLAVSGSLNLNFNLSSGKTGTSSSANASPTSGSSGLLGGVSDTVNDVGGAMNNAISGEDSVVVAIVTPVASGLQSVALNAGQVVDAVGDTVNPAVAAVPSTASGAGNAAAGLGNTIGIAAVEATGLVPDLLDVSLDTVSDVLTNVTLSLLTVSFFPSSDLLLLTLRSRLQFK